jgi:hypothetical protein
VRLAVFRRNVRHSGVSRPAPLQNSFIFAENLYLITGLAGPGLAAGGDTPACLNFRGGITLSGLIFFAAVRFSLGGEATCSSFCLRGGGGKACTGAGAFAANCLEGLTSWSS